MSSTKRFFFARQGSLWGFISSDGQWLIPPEFSEVGCIHKNSIIAKPAESECWASYNYIGDKLHSFPSYITGVGPTSSPLQAYFKNTGCGFWNSEFEDILGPRFSSSRAECRQTSLFKFEHGLAAVLFDTGANCGIYGSLSLGVINLQGDVVDGPCGDYAAFGDGSINIKRFEDERHDPVFHIEVRHFATPRGHELSIPYAIADEVLAFRNGYAAFGIDPNATTRTDPMYQPNENLSLSDLVWGLIDANGSISISASYQNIYPFVEGLAPFQHDGLWGYLSLHGQIVISPKFQSVEFFAEGISACQDSSGFWGLLNMAGDWILEPAYDELRSESRLPL